MYGTVATAMVKSGKLDELTAIGERWNRERGPLVSGAVGSWWFQSDANPDQITIVAIFRDRATYEANAADPEQHAWHERIRALLTDDPVWNDGTVLLSGMYNGI